MKPGNKTRTLVLAVTLTLSALTLLIYGFKTFTKTDYSDFIVYHRTAQRTVSHQWNGIYDLAQNGNCPFRYAPPTLPLFTPLAALDYKASSVIWFLFQYLCFGLGFCLLSRAANKLNKDGILISSTALLFVLRFCIDSFSIGQITGTMFLCLSATLYFYLRNQNSAASAALVLPGLLKVGPVFSPVFFQNKKPGINLKTVGTAAATLLALSLFTYVLIGSTPDFIGLWHNWFNMLLSDSSFFDSSHYGSQSLNSALLRIAKTDFISATTAKQIGSASAIVTCAGIVWIWIKRTPTTLHEKTLHFSMGILAYLWLMPFTFKYSLPLLAFPVTAVLCGKMNKWDIFTICFGALTLSLAGLDIIGPTLFFALQKASIPFLATVLIGSSVFRQALSD